MPSPTWSYAVYSMNAFTGAIIWSYYPGLLSNGFHGSAAVCNGVVYIGGTDRRLYGFDELTGALLWSYDANMDGVDNRFWDSNQAISNGMLYVGNMNGKMYCFALPTATGSATGTATITGTATESWTITATGTETRTKTGTATPTLTWTRTISGTETATSTVSSTQTRTISWTSTETETITQTPTQTRTPVAYRFWVDRNLAGAGDRVGIYLGMNFGGKYRLRVYNSVGEFIKMIREGNSNGNEEIYELWDLRNELGRIVSSGIYVLRLDYNKIYEYRVIGIVK